ncbi:MAG: hypothetical protein K6B68_14815 [Eubacterium sp.]|nr:hypothetical protein [Eubacterium sp.]
MDNEKDFDDQNGDIRKETRELTEDDLNEISGGRGGVPNPYETCVQQGHDYVNTGESKTETHLLWDFKLYKYVCSRCGSEIWKSE